MTPEPPLKLPFRFAPPPEPLLAAPALPPLPTPLPPLPPPPEPPAPPEE